MPEISKDGSLKMKGIRLTGVLSLAAMILLSLPWTPPLAGEQTFAAQGTDLWGGPGAKGVGAAGSRYDTIVHVRSSSAAVGAVDFWAGGLLVSTAPFSIPAQGVANVPAPDALTGLGSFLYRVRSDASVSAWSETYNDTASGRFGVSFSALAAADLLSTGDEANGGGADASSSTAPGRARTNVGVLCSPLSGGACQVEVAVFDGGALVGTGTLNAGIGAASQASLASLVPASAERTGLGLRMRFLGGVGTPYVIRNDNLTSDGTAIPLSVLKGSFSTAPTISYYTGAPLSGCSPLSVSLSWSTVGAVRVSISGVSGDLPASGTATATVLTTSDLVLTAFSASGETASQPIRVTVLAPSQPPTPNPASASLNPGGTISGILPFDGSRVTATFTRHDSTGSTFVITGNSFKYTAGTATGTDVVQLSNDTGCGAATALFTATVSLPGPPQILSFYADPSSSCRAANNIILYWATANATSVSLNTYAEAIPVTGSVVLSYPATDLDPSKTYTLTARGPGGKAASATITVPVDSAVEYPIATPSTASVTVMNNITVTVSGVTQTENVGWWFVQNQSGGAFYPTGTGTYTYHAGPNAGATDVVWITFRNGCGYTHSEFRATVHE
jgi:large repetitive protein